MKIKLIGAAIYECGTGRIVTGKKLIRIGEVIDKSDLEAKRKELKQKHDNGKKTEVFFSYYEIIEKNLPVSY
jgi:hypothetical protein